MLFFSIVFFVSVSVIDLTFADDPACNMLNPMASFATDGSIVNMLWRDDAVLFVTANHTVYYLDEKVQDGGAQAAREIESARGTEALVAGVKE